MEYCDSDLYGYVYGYSDSRGVRVESRGRGGRGGGDEGEGEEDGKYGGGPELNTTYNDINWINSSFDGGLALG